MAELPPRAGEDTATRVFVEHRELLFSIVYAMLGGVDDTEDVLQETWLSWVVRHREPEAPPIDHPRGYLVRVAMNQALARQAAVRRRRESYVGPWLPEPLLTSEDTANTAVLAESVSMALFVVLETLSPLERAVFVLHEVFGYAHTETAVLLGRDPAAIRQLAHRARAHVHARRPRYQPDKRLGRQVTERFLAAAVGGDLKALLAVLAPGVTMWNDAGGKVPKAGRRPVRGRDRVARFLIGVATQPPRGLAVDYRNVNGDPAALLFVRDSLFAVMILELAPSGDQVRGIYAVANPDKLSRLA